MKRILASALALVSATLFAADALEAATASAAALAQGISEEEAALPPDWQGKVAFGAESLSGNTDKDALSGHAEAKKLRGDVVVIATADAAWEQTEVSDADGSNTRDEKTKGNAKAEINVKRRLGGYFVYGDLSVANDDIAGVKYRLVESVGLGTFLVDTDTLKLSVEAGVAGVQEELDDSDEYVAYRLAERLDWVPSFGEGVSFFESASILADFDDSDRYFANAEAGVDIPMVFGLSVSFKGYVNYNNQPASGKEKTDRGVVAQIGYNF